MSTKIEWCDETINPIQDKIKGKSGRGYHCTRISDGCSRCYAEGINKRFGNGLPFDKRKVEFELIQSELEKPMGWKKPRRIFVQSMGDLFHKDIPTRHIQSVFDVIKKCPQHTFLILTKRIEEFWNQRAYFLQGPLPENMWLGVTIEHPKYGYRADYLRKIPAAVRFLSLEPLLADFSEYPGVLDDMDWCIVGGESGPGARPMHPDWVRSVRDQCQETNTPFFFKQWGEYMHGSNLPEDEPLNAKTWKWAGEGKTAAIMGRVGKKAAGRLLDGREWNEYPTPGH